MLRTFRASRLLKRTIDATLADLYVSLQTGSFLVPEAQRLARVDHAAMGPGSKPVVVLAASESERYIYKVGEPALAAAEAAAYQLRRLGTRPCIPAAQLSIRLDEFGETRGSLKPFVEWESEKELQPDTQTWSTVQRSVLLLDHAWEWFLDNLDTNTTQYRLFGEHQVPLNIDWDRAFATGGESPMSRFVKHRAALPNARTFLYADYVAGRNNLAFDLLFREARLIAALPRGSVASILEQYAAVAFTEPSERMAFVRRMVDRQRTIMTETTAFVRDLVRERRLYAAPKTLLGKAKSAGAELWHSWQILLNGVLHSWLATATRSILTLVRARREQQRDAA